MSTCFETSRLKASKCGAHSVGREKMSSRVAQRIQKWTFLALVIGAVGVACAPVAAAEARPRAEIVSKQPLPRMLGPAGGLIVIQADVRNVLQCTIKVLSHQPFQVIYSHAPSFGCQSGYFTPHILVGPNQSSLTRTIMFEIVAKNATSTARAFVPVKIATKTAGA